MQKWFPSYGEKHEKPRYCAGHRSPLHTKVCLRVCMYEDTHICKNDFHRMARSMRNHSIVQDIGALYTRRYVYVWHAHTRTHTHTHTHTHTRTPTHTRPHTHTHTHIHTHIHTHTPAYTHAYTHIHIPTNTRIHIQKRVLCTHSGCLLPPKHGAPESPVSTHCSMHALSNHVIKSSRYCRTLHCYKVPVFGWVYM